MQLTTQLKRQIHSFVLWLMDDEEFRSKVKEIIAESAMTCDIQEQSRLVGTTEAARILNVSTAWVKAHKEFLGCVPYKFGTKKAYKFDANKLVERYNQIFY